MSHLLNVSSSPHVRSGVTTTGIMGDVLIALVPATLFGVYNFGARAALIILICVITCVLTEFVWQNLMKKPVTIGDLSAVVTGLLLALNLPPTVPLWIPFIGGVFAILVVKQLFGGLGQNFMNPALAARCFLLISFAGRMTTFAFDGVTGATPLMVMRNGGEIDLLAMFLGRIGGCIGETSAVALLLGGAYLLFKRVISWRIPFLYIGSFALFTFFAGGFDLPYVAAQVCGGGLLLGAFFMATDYVTSPITRMGQLVYGMLLGLLTGIFRQFGGNAEGVSYAIIFCNLLVPLIEKVTLPTAFGKEGLKHAKK